MHMHTAEIAAAAAPAARARAIIPILLSGSVEDSILWVHVCNGHLPSQLDNYQCHDYYPSYMDVGELRPGNRSMVRRLPIAANEGASEEKCGVDRLECAWTGDLWTAEVKRPRLAEIDRD